MLPRSNNPRAAPLRLRCWPPTSRTILEGIDICVVADAADGTEAVSAVMRDRPDVVVMDIRMPGRDGLSATVEIVRSAPGTHVLVLTTFDDDASVFGALEAGATGFLLKNSQPEELRSAVRRAARGDAVLDPGVLGRVVRRVPAGSRTARCPRATRGSNASLSERRTCSGCWRGD